MNDHDKGARRRRPQPPQPPAPKRKPSDLDRILNEFQSVLLALKDLLFEAHETSCQLRKLNEAVSAPGQTAGHGSTTIHVTAVELKQEETKMRPIDHMPDMQLPSASVRAKLSVHNPRKADGSRIDTPTWSTSDESALPLVAIEDANVQVADPSWTDPGDGSVAPLIDEVDAADGQPNKVYSTYANTPLDAGEGTVTFRAAGVADCDIKIKYSDPAVGHVAIIGVEAVEE